MPGSLSTPERVADLLRAGPSLSEIYRHAETAYPEECCGLLLASGLRRCTNIQNELHESDGACHPRTARTGFTLDPESTLFLARSFETGDPVLAVYHSHVDQPAYFSKADREGVSIDGHATYPTLLHLVISCGATGVNDARLFAFRGKDVIQVAQL